MARVAAFLPFPDRHGRAPVPMRDLALRLTAAGVPVAVPYQAGNLVLDPGGRTPQEMVTLITGIIGTGWALWLPVILRDHADLAALVDASPFPAPSDPARIMVTLLRDDPDPAGVRTLGTYRGPEPVRLIGREIWTLYGEDVARSPFTNLPLEALLGTPCVARTLSTLRHLARLTAG